MEYGCHPPPRTDGSRGGQLGRRARIHPLAGRHLSKNGVGLLGWILERAFRGVLVYGGIGRSVGSGPDGAAGVGATRPESRAARLSRRFSRPGSGEPAFRGGSAAPDLAYPLRGAEGSPRGASHARRKAAKGALRNRLPLRGRLYSGGPDGIATFETPSQAWASRVRFVAARAEYTGGGGTTSTLQRAWRTTSLAMLPRNSRWRPPRPGVPRITSPPCRSSRAPRIAPRG